MSLGILFLLWGASYKLSQYLKASGRSLLGAAIEWGVIGCFGWFAYDAAKVGDLAMGIVFAMCVVTQLTVTMVLPPP